MTDHPEVVIQCAAMIKVLDVNQATLELYQAESKEAFFRGLDQIIDTDEIALFQEETWSKILVTITDITEHKRVEEQLRTYQDHLEELVAERTQALQQKNEMLQSTLHQLQETHNILKEQIVERQRAEEALQLTQFSIENAADAVYWVGQGGQLLYVNEAACRSLGYSRHELLNLTIHDIDPNYPAHVWASHWKTTQHGSIVVESRHRKKNGTDFPVEVTFTYLEFKGRAYNFVSARDITWRRWAAEALKESEERYRLIADRLQSELALARDIQQSLLPPASPGWPGLELICYTQPAREVGGDFYSYHAFSDNHFGLVVGDVSGKGASAALLMAASLSLFNSTSLNNLRPGELLAALDQALVPYTKPRRQNCALCYVKLTLSPSNLDGQRKSGTLHIANAGGIPPYIRRGDRLEQPLIGGFALGRGLGSELGYQEISLELSERDIIILVSDGVIEATNARGEMFGFERLNEALVMGPQTSAEAMLNYLKATLSSFVAETEPHDDMTIVVAQAL